MSEQKSCPIHGDACPGDSGDMFMDFNHPDDMYGVSELGGGDMSSRQLVARVLVDAMLEHLRTRSHYELDILLEGEGPDGPDREDMETRLYDIVEKALEGEE